MLSRSERIILIRHVENTYANITTKPLHENSIPVKSGDNNIYYVTPHPAFDSKQDIYLFPVVLNSDGTPWQDANMFLFSSTRDNKKGFSNSDAVRQKASMLLDYKCFCEQKKLNPMNFLARMPKRPTYRYFIELLRQLNDAEIKRHSLNKKNKVVYDFYKYLSEQPNSNIDLNRVDSVDSVKLFFRNSHGRSYSINHEKRGQTVAVSKSSAPVPIGFIREYGEDLRPLRESELKELISVLESDHFSIDERLMHYIAMHTGARKQTILTMRMKHLKEFTKEKLLKDETYSWIQALTPKMALC